MRVRVATILAACLLAVAVAGPVMAITNGTPDNGRHPYVGLLVFDDAPGHPAWRCSGTLLSPTVVLTAGHCTSGAVAARAWFDELVSGNPDYPRGGPSAYEGVPYTFPGYVSPVSPGLTGFSFGDVGVVVLSRVVPTSAVATYGQLPAAGLVGTLPNKTPLDYVGYGVQFQVKQPGPPIDRWAGKVQRLYAFGELVSGKFAIGDDVIKVTLNPGGGSGGTCFGDSGGPDLLGGTSTVLAVNSFVTNANCSGVGYDTRVDRPERLAWINGFITAATCTFAASDTRYYNGPTSGDPLYGNGPITFTWKVSDGGFVAGEWTEIAPAFTGGTYHNVFASGTVIGGAVNLVTAPRTSPPDGYRPFTVAGTLTGGSFTGTADGPYLLTASGAVTCGITP